MYELKNIAIYALKNERIVELAEIVSRMFPHSVIHVVTSFTTIKSRALYTRLLSDTLHRIAEESVKSVEDYLRRRGVRIAGRKILVGDPVKALSKYISMNRIGLIATLYSLNLDPREASREIGSFLIASLYVPVLVYTGFTSTPREVREILVIVKDLEALKSCLAIINYVSRHEHARITVHFLGKPKPRELEYVKVQVLSKGMNLSIAPLLPKSRDELVKTILCEAEHSSMVFLQRAVLKMFRRISFIPRHRLSYGESILLCSIPVVTIVF